MKITINYGDGVITLPLGIMNSIEAVNENELKLLICLCQNSGGDINQESICSRLGISPTELESSLSFLRGTGLVKTGRKSKKAGEKNIQADKEIGKEVFTPLQETKKEIKIISNSVPQYSGPELDALVMANPALERLRIEAESENMFNRPLHHAELNMLVTLYDYYHFDEAYILQLLSISKDKSRPMHYAYKLGTDFYSRNILDFDTLLEELAKLERKNSFEGKMRKLFGIEQRELSSREKSFFSQWQCMDYELVEYAYEQTVNSTGKASMPYMNKILMTFRENRITSVAQAKESHEKHKEGISSKGGSFDEKDFFNIALQGSYGKEQKMKDGKTQ